MKRETARFSLLVVTFVLVTQLFALAPLTQAMQCGGQGNGNKKQTYAMRVDPDPAQPGTRGRRRRGMGRNCGWRCRREYSRCLANAGGNQGRRRACAVRYRNCLRRCG